jgi:CheY-like chemotaxis protein
MRILIVDDNSEMRSIIRSLLVHDGDEIRECSSSEEAVMTFAGFRPDAVVMDIQMGGIDGLAATRVIKQQQPNTRVIVVTNFADDQMKRAALHAGADAFVSKEDLIHLKDTIRRTA